MSTRVIRLPSDADPHNPEHRERIRRHLTRPGQVPVHLDIAAATVEVAETRPGATRIAWGPAVTRPTPQVIADVRNLLRTRGQALAAVDVEARAWIAMTPTAQHLRTRDKIARALRCEPHEIELGISQDAQHVAVTRWPAQSGDSERERLIWLDVARSVIGHEGWTSKVDATRGVVELHAGARIEIPSSVRVDPREYLEASDQWSIPFGVDGRGRPVTWDILRSPHALVSGLTGSGKTVSLYAIAAGAIARGFELAICETSKSGADFTELRPFVSEGLWGCDDKHSASQVIQRIYDMKDDRMARIVAAGHKKLHSMSRREQEEHGLRPLLLLIDEAAALLASPPTIPGLPRDHPVQIEAQAEQVDVALAGDRIRRIAAELRAAGVHVCFATQLFDVSLLKAAGGSLLRGQLGLRVLMGRASTTQIAQSVVRADAAAVAYETAHGQSASDDGAPDLYSQPSPGRAIVETDSATTAIQAVYAPESEWVAALEALGVPTPGGSAPDTDSDSGSGVDWDAA